MKIKNYPIFLLFTLVMAASPFQLELFMQRHGFDSYEALIERADRDPEWFWPAVRRALEVEWDAGYWSVIVPVAPLRIASHEMYRRGADARHEDRPSRRRALLFLRGHA